VLGHERQQIDGPCIQTLRLVGVAADQEEVVYPRLGHGGEERIEVLAVAYHAGGHVHGYGVS
jgi:hypothetical protein